MKAIDVSEWNGVIDWEKVKKAGIECTIIRGGFGFDTIDKRFHENAKEANKAGIKVEMYWFSYAVNNETAIEEAQFTIKLAKQYPFIDAIHFDFEYASVDYGIGMGYVMTKDRVQNIAKSFCETIIKNGYKTSVYFNKDYYRKYFDENFFKKTGLNKWVAHWTDNENTSPFIPALIHQFTCTGKIDGIYGNVDINNYLSAIPNKTNFFIDFIDKRFNTIK